MNPILMTNYFTFQEVLNLYPARAPRFPHDKDTPFNWFTKMLDDAGLEPAVFTLSEFFTDELIEEIINALITIVYYRHDEDYIYQVTTPCHVDYQLTQDDFRKAIKKLMNVLDLTIPKYVPILQQNEIYSTDPVAPIKSESAGETRFNDTPQNIGEYGDSEHTTNISNSKSESVVDTGSIMERLSALFKDFKSIILEWSNEFNSLFLKEEQIHE